MSPLKELLNAWWGLQLKEKIKKIIFKIHYTLLNTSTLKKYCSFLFLPIDIYSYNERLEEEEKIE